MSLPDIAHLDLSKIDLSHLAPSDRAVVEEFLRRKQARAKGETFLDYLQAIAPWFVIEEVHIAIAEQLERIVTGEIDRLMLFIAPRTGKSQLASVFFPTYYIGKFPHKQIMQVGHSATMSEGFGREARNLIATPEYGEIFPETRLSKDSRSVSAWATTKNGKYSTAGVDTGIAGKGYALGILDDLLNEKTAISSTAKNAVWEWYGPGFYSRKMPRDPKTGAGSCILNIQTRWSTDDLAGRLLAQQAINPDADKWEVLSIPAVLDEKSADLLTRISHDPKYAKYLPDANRTFTAGGSFSPRRFPLEDLMRTKHGSTMSPRAWAALYQQTPVAEEGGLLRSDWWVKWSDKLPMPRFTYIFQSYDVASETAVHNDFTARTTWGVFRRPADGVSCVMVLEYSRFKLDFPDLIENALESYREYKPDRVVVEKASSGIPMYQEFRKRGIPVSPIRPQGTKYSRADAATILLSQGVVYYPDRRWAQDLIALCAAFPAGEEDDSVDSAVQGINYARRMMLLETPDDEQADDADMDKTHARSYAVRRTRLPAVA